MSPAAAARRWPGASASCTTTRPTGSSSCETRSPTSTRRAPTGPTRPAGDQELEPRRGLEGQGQAEDLLGSGLLGPETGDPHDPGVDPAGADRTRVHADGDDHAHRPAIVGDDA